MLSTQRRYGAARPPSSAMLDALEAAEADYERRASGLDAGAAAEAAAAAAAAELAAEVAPPDTPRKAAICEATRERIIQALFQALQANPRWVGAGAAGASDGGGALRGARRAHSARHAEQVCIAAAVCTALLSCLLPTCHAMPCCAVLCCAVLPCSTAGALQVWSEAGPAGELGLRATPRR